MAAAESYPEDLKYHPEHDWARIEGDEAVLGITWWAQDALGELVHFEAPAVGGTTTKDEPYGEVESVKAVSDVIAPLSGRDPRGEREGDRRRARDRSTTTPTARAGSSGSGSATRREVDALLDVEAYRRSWPSNDRRLLSLTDADRDEMLAAIGVASVDDLFAQIPADVRFERELDVPPALTEAGARAAPRGARREERRHVAASSRSSAPASTTTTSRRSSTRSCGAASS